MSASPLNLHTRKRRKNAGSRMQQLLSYGLSKEEDTLLREVEKEDDVFEISAEIEDEYDSDFEKYAKDEELHEQMLEAEGFNDEMYIAKDEKKRAREVKLKKNAVWKAAVKPKPKVIKSDDTRKHVDKTKESEDKKRRDKLQEKRLLEAIKTEQLNTKSLKTYQENEEEYKKQLLQSMNRKPIQIDPGPRQFFYSTTVDRENEKQAVNYMIFYKYPQGNQDIPDDWWHFKSTTVKAIE